MGLGVGLGQGQRSWQRSADPGCSAAEWLAVGTAAVVSHGMLRYLLGGCWLRLGGY